MHRSVLITGGAGFVGANLAVRLKAWKPDLEVIAFDNLKRRGSEFNLARLKEAGVRFAHGDVRIPGDFPGAAVDLILDCAAEPSVLAGYGDGSPEYLIQTNLAGTCNVLELARRHRADLIFLSTSRVYPVEPLNGLRYVETDRRFAWTADQEVPGASAEGISEAFPLDGARSLYGCSKLCSELLIQEYGAAYGLRAIINRCGVLTGPWQMGKTDQGVFALWMARHYFGLPLTYTGWGGTGKQVRDLLHVDDLWELLRLQIEAFGQWAGYCFNVGGGRKGSLSLQETTEICQDLTGTSVLIQGEAENRPGDVRIFITDHRRVTTLTGWEPQIGPRETLEGIFDWIRENEAVVRPVFTGKGG